MPQNLENTKEYLSLVELSVLLGISDETLRQATRKGELPTEKIGKRTIYPIQKIMTKFYETHEMDEE